MILSLSQFPSSPFPLPVPPASSSSVNYPTAIKFNPNPLSNFTILTTKNRKKNHRAVVNAAEEEQKPTTAESETPSDEELGAEIKKAMMEREVRKEESILGGVAEEIGQIEWPSFNKVLGTTGVVLGVIAGSSVVLLTVNAILAELSDRVFAGRGVQDIFG